MVATYLNWLRSRKRGRGLCPPILPFRFRQGCVFQSSVKDCLAFPYRMETAMQKPAERRYHEREHSTKMDEKKKVRKAYGFEQLAHVAPGNRAG